MTLTMVDLYYDYTSPYAHILAHRVGIRAAAWQCPLAWRPIDLDSLMQREGRGEYSERRFGYVAHDVLRTALFHEVPIGMPKSWPVRSGLALRVSLLARERDGFDRLREAIFHAAWVDGDDIADAAVLAPVIDGAGLEAQALLAEARDGEATEALAAATDAAYEAGVFGVPTLVFDGELFWGDDRLAVLEWRLAEKGILSSSSPAP